MQKPNAKKLVFRIAVFIVFFLIYYFIITPPFHNIADKIPTFSDEEYLYLSVDQPLNTRALKLNNPLTDESFSPDIKNTRRYSHFRCSGDDNDVMAFGWRLCVFENVCYNVASKKFNYYSRPSTPKPVLFDSKYGERFNFSEGEYGFVAVQQVFADNFAEALFFSPDRVYDVSPAYHSPKTTVILKDVHSLYSHWSGDDSLGHVLWEEIGGLWYAMVRMNVLSNNLRPLHYPKPLPERELSKTHRNNFFKAVTPHDPQSFDEYITSLTKTGDVKDVCFDNVLVGGQLIRFFANVAWHNHAHELLFWSLRNRILQHYGLFSETPKLPTNHLILLTNKTVANYKNGQNLRTKRTIYNLNEIYEKLKEKFSGTTVEIRIVDWSEMEVKQQLELIQKATLVITPPGGVSMLLPFLNEGAHVIMTDYPGHNEKPWIWFGTSDNESISMDAAFWNHWPHIKKLYYQVWNGDELVSDLDGVSVEDNGNWRDFCSVKVVWEKLNFLVDAAIEDMEM